MKRQKILKLISVVISSKKENLFVNILPKIVDIKAYKLK